MASSGCGPLQSRVGKQLISQELVAVCATGDLGAPFLLLCFSGSTDFRVGKDPAAAVEVDRRLGLIAVVEAASGLLEPLDDGLDTPEPSIGEVMAQVGQQVRPPRPGFLPHTKADRPVYLVTWNADF